jgi:hypothetical protein
MIEVRMYACLANHQVYILYPEEHGVGVCHGCVFARSQEEVEAKGDHVGDGLVEWVLWEPGKGGQW